jgi:hypothetical protein
MCSFLQPLTLGQELVHSSLMVAARHLQPLLLVAVQTRFQYIVMALFGKLVN